MSILLRTAGFSAGPLLAALIGFTITPVLSRTVGTVGWAQIALGQSFGAMLVAFIGYGWDLRGPAKLVVADEKQRAVLFSESFVSRGLLFLVLAPFCFIMPNLLVAGEYGLQAGILALGTALTGVVPNWYVVGVGKPILAIKFDVLPRILVLSVAAALFYITKIVLIYPLAILLISALSVIFFSIFVSKPFVQPRQSVWQIYRKNFSATATMVVASSYSSSVIVLLALVSTQEQVALYGSGYALYNFALISLIILGNSLQSWVMEGGNKRFLFRVKKVLFYFAGLGFLGFLGFLSLGSWITARFLGEHLRIDFLTSFGFGLAFFSLAIGTVSGRLFLVPLAKTKFVMTSSIVGASFGVPTILICSKFFGASGAALALAFSEILVFGMQCIMVRRCLLEPLDVEKQGS